MMSQTQLITECTCSVISVTKSSQANCNPHGGLGYLAKWVLLFLGFKMTNFSKQILRPLGTYTRDFTVAKTGTEKSVERATTVQNYSF